MPDKKSEVQFVEIINIIKDLYISKNIIFKGEYNYLILAEQYKLVLTAIMTIVYIGIKLTSQLL